MAVWSLLARGLATMVVMTDDPALAARVHTELAEPSPDARLLLRFRDLWDEEPRGLNRPRPSTSFSISADPAPPVPGPVEA